MTYHLFLSCFKAQGHLDQSHPYDLGQSHWISGPRFWYIYFQTSRDLIPAAYENERKLIDLFDSLFNIGGIRTL